MRSKNILLSLVTLSALIWQGLPTVNAAPTESSVEPTPPAQIGEKRTSTTGAIFTRVERNGFGESWMDPSGVTWGDTLLNSDGSHRHVILSIEYADQAKPMDFRGAIEGAQEYCHSLGARLPSNEEFLRLAKFLGADRDDLRTFTPQILPNLTDDMDDFSYDSRTKTMKRVKIRRNANFWSGDTFMARDTGYYFDGSFGSLFPTGGAKVHTVGVRCVEVNERLQGRYLQELDRAERSKKLLSSRTPSKACKVGPSDSDHTARE